MRSLTFAEILEKHVPVRSEGECWLWRGHIDKFGYGKITWKYTGYLAHRLLYTWLKGPIPEGTELDHLCSNRSCVNPEHLEPVEHEENVRRANERRTTCLKGLHELSDENTVTTRHGSQCRPCKEAARVERIARERRAREAANPNARRGSDGRLIPERERYCAQGHLYDGSGRCQLCKKAYYERMKAEGKLREYGRQHRLRAKAAA